MANEIFDPTQGVPLQIMFGCSVRSIETQYGLNQTPSVWTVTVVRDADGGQRFRFDKDGDGIRSVTSLSLSALNMIGIVQSWEQTVIDVGGRDVFVVKVTDTKPVLDSVQVFLHAGCEGNECQLVVDYGENVVPVRPRVAEDLEFGLLYTDIKKEIEGETFRYGNDRFKVDLGGLRVNNRDFRLKGSIVSLTQVVSDAAEANGYDWVVDTVDKGSHFLIRVSGIKRTNIFAQPTELNLNALANLHAGRVVTRKDGFENRDGVNRTVLIGPNRKILTENPPSFFDPFWGWDIERDDLAPLTRPTFFLRRPNGRARRMRTSVREMEAAINGDLDDSMRREKLDALKDYAQRFWGKQFIVGISDFNLDSADDPWIETTPAAWYELNRNPARLNRDGEERFATEDGLWVGFAELPVAAGKWDLSVVNSVDVVKSLGRLYMKITTERVGKYIIVTMPQALAITTQLREFVPDEPVGPSFQGGPHGRSTFFDIGSPGQELPGGGFEIRTRTVRVTKLGKAWIPIFDRRKFYGPWASDDPVAGRFRLHGRTEMKSDNNLAPWTFGFRGVTNAQAASVMDKVARASIRANTTRVKTIDTGALVVADIPRVNLGAAVGRGANITGVGVGFGGQRISTNYRVNQFTGELNVFRAQQQALVDGLMRELRRRQNTLYGQTNLFDIMEELKTLKKSLPGSAGGVNFGGISMERKQGGLGVITGKVGNKYNINRLDKEVKISQLTGVEVKFITSFNTEWFNVQNLAEPSGPGYLPIGTQVTVSMFASGPFGPFVPYIEQTPPSFQATGGGV